MPLWKHIERKTQAIAFLLAKPTPRNVNQGNDRFAMFNKERDIPLENLIRDCWAKVEWGYGEFLSATVRTRVGSTTC